MPTHPDRLHRERLHRDGRFLGSRDDESMLHACEVVSYFSFVNRMANGLNVRLEAGMSGLPVRHQKLRR